MTDVPTLKRCIHHLEAASKIGVEGILTKLDWMVYGLRYVELVLSSSDDSRTAQLFETTGRHISQWCEALRPKKALKQKFSLAKASNKKGSLHTATALLESKPLWEEVKSILQHSINEALPASNDS
jgi:hypothetical protein